MFENLKLNYKVWLENNEGAGVLGDGKWLLLKAIEETNSFKAAAKKLNLSYRKTWNNMKQIEHLLGFELLETTSGGSDGGSSVLTPKAKLIVQAFNNFHQDFDVIIQTHFEKFLAELKKIET